MDLNNVQELKSELSRLYRALDESESEVEKLTNQNVALKADRELLVSQNVEGASQGQVAKKVVELGKKIRALSTELEAEKTKSRNAEKNVRILTNQNDQLKAKLKQSNQEIKNFGDDGSMYSIDVISKNYEAKIRDLQKNEQSLKKQVEQLNLEIKSQKRILELELGENVVSASQVLTGNWKGRQQQILSLQSRIQELERIKNQNTVLPQQVKQLKKENLEFFEKHKNLMKEKDDEIQGIMKKNNMSKSRNQTLINQQRILKEHIVALEEKGRHDDELIAALSARLKSTSLKKEHNSPQKSSPVKLESKESIVEIKQLRTKIANLENELNSKDLEMKCLQQTVTTLEKSLDERPIQQLVEKSEKFETDSLDGDKEPFHLNVQIETLNKEMSILKGQLEKSRKDYEELIERLFSKRMPEDELTADDLRSLRAVLQAQISGRSKDTKYYQDLLEQNRKAFLEAVQIMRK